MSVVTREMIEAYAKRYEIDLADGSQEPGIVGSLEGIAAGRSSGDKLAFLLDAPETRKVFAPLRKAFFESLGFTEPAYSQVSGEAPAAPAAE